MKTEKQKVLVTGANGFIGSHMTTALYNKGYFVTGLSRKGLGKNEEYNKLVNENRIETIKGDISTFDFNTLEHFDYIIHIAGKVSAYGKMEDFLKINYEATRNLLESLLSKKPKCFVYFSSTAVYGYNGYENLKEDAEKKPFKNPYSLTKLKTEEFVKEFCTKNNIDFVIIRPGNVFGEYDYTSSHEIFTRVKKEKMLVSAGGKYKSCFVYVKNLVDATITAMENEKAHNTDYNVTDGKNETLKEYLTMVAEEFKVRPKFTNFPAFLAKTVAVIVEGTYYLFRIKKAPLITKFSVWQNCANYSFDISKIKSIGYEPKFDMQEGIKRTCDWINKLEEEKVNDNKRRNK